MILMRGQGDPILLTHVLRTCRGTRCDPGHDSDPDSDSDYHSDIGADPPLCIWESWKALDITSLGICRDNVFGDL